MKQDLLIQRNDDIIIDTCSLMNHSSFSSFLKTNADKFRDQNKKIIIPYAVYCELTEQMNSTDMSKRDSAEKANSLLKDYIDIISVEDYCLDDEEKTKAFADAELLARLTKNRTSRKQLLISNDKRLTADAYNLNRSESCFGNDVWVSYLSESGKLKTCDCVYKETEPRTMQKTEANEKNDDKKKIWIPLVGGLGIAASCFGVGFYFGNRNRMHQI